MSAPQLKMKKYDCHLLNAEFPLWLQYTVGLQTMKKHSQ